MATIYPLKPDNFQETIVAAFGPTTLAAYTLVTAQNETTDSVDVTHVCQLQIQAIWTGLTGVLDGVLSVERSNDNTAFSAVSGLTLTLSSAASNGFLTLDKTKLGCKYIRVVYTINGTTGGTLTLKLAGQG